MKKIILSDPEDFSFSSANRLFNFRTAIVLGACRSGKTSLGTLIGSCQFVDNIEEPWTAKIITLLSGLRMVPENLCKQILLNFITESYNETVLFRTQSFRPSDMSSIWRQKSSQEITDRLTKYQTRQDVQDYIRKNNPLFFINLTEVQSFTKLLTETLKNTKLLHVVRNGFEVASECMLKKWFSNEQLENPIKALPYKLFTFKKTLYHLPWWVGRDEEELFLSYSDYEKCIYYWCQTIEPSVIKLEQLNEGNNNKTIKYSELLRNTKEIFLNICDYLDISPTEKSYELVDEISHRQSNPIHKETIDTHLKRRADYLNEHYGL
jgi:hypothetical protein